MRKNQATECVYTLPEPRKGVYHAVESLPRHELITLTLPKSGVDRTVCYIR